MENKKASNARDIGPMTIAVAEELNALLGRKKMSASRLSREANIPRATLHKSLNAQRAIDVDDVHKICDHLGESSGDLIERAERLVYERMDREAASDREPVSLDTHRARRLEKNDSGSSEDVIPEDVEDAWAGRYAADGKGDDPIDHSQ